MPLAPGSRLGRYDIVAPLGEGGMGEVYRARDSRLQRTVAIKILRLALAEQPELRSRFRREAEAIAALRHPHICVLYDVGESEDIDFLVMEHLEGETLAARLRRAPLPSDQVLRYGIEIASALAAAHQHGFLHRDLKPGNVMLTADGAKVLDFGLAKPIVEEGAVAGIEAPTKTAPLTVQGTIVGTLGYMAPEQLEGKPADTRSDVFALGAVLYEMATGRKAFAGGTQASLIAAVLGARPDVRALEQTDLHPLFRRIVGKCLEKDPARRWQSAMDLVDALRWLSDEAVVGGRPLGAGDATPPAMASALRRYRLAALAAGAIAVSALALVAVLALRGPAPATARAGPLRLSILPPPGTTFTPREVSLHPQFALAPDGRRLVFVAGRVGEPSRLWVRSLATGGALPLPGTEDASGPFWSPDGNAIGFFARGKLKRVGADGSAIQDLADVTFDVTTGSWGPDDVILFGGGTGQHLVRVAASGGAVERASELDAEREEVSHRWPQLLPDGRHFLVYVGSAREEWSGVYLATIGASSKRQLLHLPANAVYADPGYLLYEEGGYLTAQRFDVRSGTLEGPGVRLPDRAFANHRSTFFVLSAASQPTLAFWQGGTVRTELVWVDRAGRVTGRLEQNGHGLGFSLSADMTRVVFTRRGPADSGPGWGDDDLIWVDLASGIASRLTFEGNARFATWSPDGSEVVYTTTGDLFRKPVSGAVKGVEVAGHGPHLAIMPEDWSRDGRWLLYTASTSRGWDIGVVDLAGAESKALLETPANELQPRVSPTGRWLAYISDENGTWEVYVQPFPGGPGRWQVSSGGGSRPYWRGDGKELYYIDTRGALVAVPVVSSDAFEAGAAAVLFDAGVLPLLAPFRGTYAATADGERFLVERMLPQAEPTSLSILLDWPAALEETRPSRAEAAAP